MNEKFVAKPKTTAWKFILKCEQFPKLKSSILLKIPFYIIKKLMSRHFYSTGVRIYQFFVRRIHYSYFSEQTGKNPANLTSVYEFLWFLKFIGN